MKELILSTSIILIIAVLCVFTLKYTNNMCRDINANLTECSKRISESDWDGASQSFNKAHKIYDSKMPLLKTFFDHKNLIEIQNLFVKIGTALSIRNTETGILEINTLISDFNTLSISEIPSVSNII